MQSAASNQSPAAAAACERNVGMGPADYFAPCTQVRTPTACSMVQATAGRYQAAIPQWTNRADYPLMFVLRANQGSAR